MQLDGFLSYDCDEEDVHGGEGKREHSLTPELKVNAKVLKPPEVSRRTLHTWWQRYLRAT